MNLKQHDKHKEYMEAEKSLRDMVNTKQEYESHTVLQAVHGKQKK